MESRFHIAVEKYVKQVLIEAETMGHIARSQILPAALQHQSLLAEAVGKTIAAGVSAPEQKAALERFVGYANGLREAIGRLEGAMTLGEGDPMEHAKHIKEHLIPAMADVRAAADHLETVVTASYWPMPTYREMLFIK